MSSPSLGQKLAFVLRQHAPEVEVFADHLKTGRTLDTWSTKPARPLARVECRSVADVQAALHVAREFGVPLTVSGGRCDPFARANRDGHLIVDLRRMAAVSYDGAANTVTVQGGTTTGDLLRALPEDLVTVTGKNAMVGVVGLTLGGGYGPLNGRFGLACDTLQSAQIVLADGQVIDASRGGDAELFWALRGGGTGFGLVTSLTLATHALARVLSATVFFPLASATQALLMTQELLDQEPDPLSLLPLFTTGPDGRRGLFLTLLWNGEPSRGQEILRELTLLQGAEVVEQGWVRYQETLDPPELWPWGRRWITETQTLARLDEPTVEALVEAARRMSSPMARLFLHDFHGAAARIAPGATAFPLRSNHFVVGICASWHPEKEHEAEAQRLWVAETSARLATAAYQGGYVNFLSPDQHERACFFYGAAAERLRRIKKRLDPDDIFQASTGRLQSDGYIGDKGSLVKAGDGLV